MYFAGRTTSELISLARELGQPDYRGRQLSEWVYRRAARSIEEMTSLPSALRRELAERVRHPVFSVVATSSSLDGTTRFLVEASDGARVECVFLPYDDRASVCVSTQVGCAMDCSFCATGIGGLSRNLEPGEIVDQVLLAQAARGRRITHVVYMGMGEPLANYQATLTSIRLLSGEAGISPRRITVSTVGLPEAIRKLASEGLPITLAVSIHAPNDRLRAEIMPVARLHPLQDLIEACRFYTETTRRKMTFEYLLLDGVNDGPEHARELAALIKGCHANVNVIPYNHVEGRGDFRRPDRKAIDEFKAELTARSVTVTERMRKGNPVHAACGQLRHESANGRKLAPGPGTQEK